MLDLLISSKTPSIQANSSMIVDSLPSLIYSNPGKPVAAICHGPWLLCSARVLAGKKATCFCSIKDDVINAG